jgi:Fe-S cluster assembly iron-binding protein IscA
MNEEVEKAKQRLRVLTFKKDRSEDEEKEYKELRERIVSTEGGTPYLKKIDIDYAEGKMKKPFLVPEIEKAKQRLRVLTFKKDRSEDEEKEYKELRERIVSTEGGTPYLKKIDIDYAEGKMKKPFLVPEIEKAKQRLRDLTFKFKKEIKGSPFQEGVTVGANNTADPETGEKPGDELKPGEDGKDANYKAAVVAKMQDNIEKNKGDIIANKLINDAISIAEYFHNKKEPPYQRGSVPDVPFMVGQRISADPYLQAINRGKIAAIRNLRAAGRQDLIPTVLKQADNKAAEIRGSIDAKNAELKMAADNANMGAMMQGIQLGVSNRHFDEQMHAQHEAMRGAAQSENITNLRETLSDYQNSMTENRDNEISNIIYALSAEDPEILKSLGAWLEKKGDSNKAAYDKATARRYAQIKRRSERRDARNKPLTYGSRI